MTERFDRNDPKLPTVEEFSLAGMSLAQDFSGDTEALLRNLTLNLPSNESYEKDTEIMFQVLKEKGIDRNVTKYLLTDLSVYTSPHS